VRLAGEDAASARTLRTDVLEPEEFIVSQLDRPSIGIGGGQYTDAMRKAISRVTQLEGLGIESLTLTDSEIEAIRALPKLKQVYLSFREAQLGQVQQLCERLPISQLNAIACLGSSYRPSTS